MAKTLVVAEKPSVGKDIARVLGCRERGEGCLIGETYIVTWAIGHLVSLCEPDELDEQYKRWSYQTLPILPQTIPLKVLSATKRQYNIVARADEWTGDRRCHLRYGRRAGGRTDLPLYL